LLHDNPGHNNEYIVYPQGCLYYSERSIPDKEVLIYSVRIPDENKVPANLW